ncbi:hypothetical protein [uncultured Robinsoniella sp.]|uniref:putative ABC transporter permease n=1 Tax=uncultured Robinsoniella sp. TaxID=904190 RepID=UPI00374EE432
MKNNFIKCGICGWCLEILWTGFLSFRRRELKLTGKSSIWMFPIYGMAAFIGPIYRRINKRSAVFRGIIYTMAIFSTEFLTGAFLKKRGMCPWDYSKAKLNVKGVIRLDYAPLWFATGLLYEKILKR